jgi:hypothetical protein
MIPKTIYYLYSFLLDSSKTFIIYFCITRRSDRLCGLVVRIPGNRTGGPDSIPGASRFLRSSGSGTGSTQPREYNWGATWKKKSIGFCPENREFGLRNPSRWPRCILNLQKLALASPTSGGRSVGIVISRTEAMEFFIRWRWAYIGNIL